jgi:hemerythrin-like domain-containing protein
MQITAPLMTEHRLIMRMISLMAGKSREIEEKGQVDVLFIDAALDFIRMYADRTHHGKEEAILFKDLALKKLTAEDRRILNELLEEHGLGRKAVLALAEENKKYQGGEKSGFSIIVENLHTLVDFYPKHIEKEDKVFFPASLKYLSKEEQEAMFREFSEFDKKMIHVKYQAVVENLE